ncbi:Tetrapyrrole (Corrin/Porphyrin) Methylase [Trypanosoma brucei equiperdum]|uniref:Tetrapyrrole (Corrin/Porphyrin) Methylase n=1 Tax=Trypanosoma brucei equiperdum TaxID=630700 RepID=A0A3L6L262_9TRYP|nr:Tetrapyrrole (Corrin/Porphyrin) Methylase [Trypanosoma brucei equiperdum]
MSVSSQIGIRRHALLPFIGSVAGRRNFRGCQWTHHSCRFMSSCNPLRGSFKYRHNRTLPEDAVNPLTTPTNVDAGVLHVVSVPIGNLKDFSIRALDVLRQVDYIVTTDRPATKTLLDLVQIESQGRLIHYSRSNRTTTKEKLVELLLGGRRMALVCTSGTPCVGDVGGELVREMQAEGVRVAAVPGSCALTCALAVAGVTTSLHEVSATADTNRACAAKRPRIGSLRDGSFYFGNVLPESHGERLRVLRTAVGEATHPCVFYEVPRRLLSVLQDIALVLPKRRVVLTHELTKVNESIHADVAEKLLSFYSRQEANMLLKKGQLVLIIDGPDENEMRERLECEALKRQRLRRSFASLAGRCGNMEEKNTHDVGKTKRMRLCRRSLLRKKRREALISRIEKEQERIRMTMLINRTDATRD